MFKTNSILDWDFYYQLAKLDFARAATKKNYYVTISCFSILILCLSLLSPTDNIVLQLVMAVIGIGVLVSVLHSIYKTKPKKFADANILSNREILHHDTNSLSTFLDNDGIHCENLYTGAKWVIEYTSVGYVFNVNRYYYLLTKNARMGLPINKTALGEDERKKCLNTLRSALKNVEWINM